MTHRDGGTVARFGTAAAGLGTVGTVDGLGLAVVVSQAGLKTGGLPQSNCQALGGSTSSIFLKPNNAKETNGHFPGCCFQPAFIARKATPTPCLIWNQQPGKDNMDHCAWVKHWVRYAHKIHKLSYSRLTQEQ